MEAYIKQLNQILDLLHQDDPENRPSLSSLLLSGKKDPGPELAQGRTNEELNMGKKFIAKRFIYTNIGHTNTKNIKKTFDSFNEALTWINRSHGPIAAGGSIADQETWNTLYEIAPDGTHEDYRGPV